MIEQPINEWMETLYSKAPVPGGGGASAMAGSMAAALGGMVANLTTGKKKYAEYQEDIERILEETEQYRQAFLKLMEEYEIHREHSDAPFYDFNVTMQNHGGYSGVHGLIEENIHPGKFYFEKLQEEEDE